MELDLDLLKKDWNTNNDEFKQYSKEELFVMTKKKSVSVAKWILIIGLLEICFWTLLGWWLSIFPEEDEIYYNIRIIEHFINFVDTFSIISVFVFVALLFYLNLKIRAEENSKKLMKKILLMRKLIHWYIDLFLFQIILVSIMFIADEVITIYIKNQHLAETLFYFLFFVVLAFSLFTPIYFLVRWIYKKLVYGRMLKHLEENYKELTRIEK